MPVNLSMTPINKAKAWGVHAVTASGVILALLALLALVGLDGTLARKYEVKEMLPHFDGSVLDLVIDYLTYVFIPAIFIYRYIPLPEHFELLAVGVILV
ncbi:phosphatidylcholine synthase, partial [Pseudomonas aeruginosa]